MDGNLQSKDVAEGAESTKPHKTWFFQRGDGYIFGTRESEAWEILHNPSNWRRRDFKIIGVSDGQTFHKVLREGRSELPRLQSELLELQKEMTEYLNTENHLKYKELLDDTDERIIKLKKIKTELNGKINSKLKEINDITTNLKKKAFEAELEQARGHIEHPSNQDVIAPAGKKDQILRAMGLQ